MMINIDSDLFLCFSNVSHYFKFQLIKMTIDLNKFNVLTPTFYLRLFNPVIRIGCNFLLGERVFNLPIPSRCGSARFKRR